MFMQHYICYLYIIPSKSPEKYWLCYQYIMAFVIASNGW
jgi:hypothetical protein